MEKIFERLRSTIDEVIFVIKTKAKFERKKPEMKLSEFFRNSPLDGIDFSRDESEPRNSKAVE
jgi:hypothetical protein